MPVMMKQSITIVGNASLKTIAVLPITSEIYQRYKTLSLMNFLIDHGIRIASSCSGEGVCKKCVVNNHLISCQITLEQYLNQQNNDMIITINYL